MDDLIKLHGILLNEYDVVVKIKPDHFVFKFDNEELIMDNEKKNKLIFHDIPSLKFNKISYQGNDFDIDESKVIKFVRFLRMNIDPMKDQIEKTLDELDNFLIEKGLKEKERESINDLNNIIIINKDDYKIVENLTHIKIFEKDKLLKEFRKHDFNQKHDTTLFYFDNLGSNLKFEIQNDNIKPIIIGLTSLSVKFRFMSLEYSNNPLKIGSAQFYNNFNLDTITKMRIEKLNKQFNESYSRNERIKLLMEKLIILKESNQSQPVINFVDIIYPELINEELKTMCD